VRGLRGLCPRRVDRPDGRVGAECSGLRRHPLRW
jgi:hypothetical protein